MDARVDTGETVGPVIAVGWEVAVGAVVAVGTGVAVGCGVGSGAEHPTARTAATIAAMAVGRSTGRSLPESATPCEQTGQRRRSLILHARLNRRGDGAGATVTASWQRTARLRMASGRLQGLNPAVGGVTKEGSVGAEGEIRTHTPVRTLRPEHSASACSATSARLFILLEAPEHWQRGAARRGR